MKTLVTVALSEEIVKILTDGKVQEEVIAEITTEHAKDLSIYAFKNGGKLRGISPRSKFGLEIMTPFGLLTLNVNARLDPARTTAKTASNATTLADILG